MTEPSNRESSDRGPSNRESSDRGPSNRESSERGPSDRESSNRDNRSTGDRPRAGSDRRSRWWVAAITFVLGLGVGIVLVGLLSAQTPDFVAATGPNATPVPGASPTPSATNPAPVAAEARVNAACLRVINEAQAVSGILSGIGEAASDVDLQRLDDIVRRLQPVEPRLQSDLRACNVDVQAGSKPTSTSTAPAPTATASPTR